MNEDKAREAFEATMRALHPDWAFTPDPVFGYHNERTRFAWVGFWAALQWAASQQAAEGWRPGDKEGAKS